MSRATQSKSLREMQESWRKRIQAGKIISLVQEAAQGKREMKATQLKAAEILLRKALPDLTAVDMTSKGDSVSFAFTVKKK